MKQTRFSLVSGKWPSSWSLLKSYYHMFRHFAIAFLRDWKLCYIYWLLSSQKSGDYHYVTKIKHLSAQPNDRQGNAILQTAFASAETVNKLSYFEMWQGIGRLKLPVMAVLLTNSLLMGTPLEALAAKICETKSSMFSMPVLSLVALVGATVGGLLARQRRGELQRLNEQLRQINPALRRQAKIESYASELSCALCSLLKLMSSVVQDLTTV